MNSELRERIFRAIHSRTAASWSQSQEAADRVCALVGEHYTPPAPATEKARLPDGIEIVPGTNGGWIVRCGSFRLDDDEGYVWSKAAWRVFDTEADAHAAALKAPPVPKSEEKPHYMIPKVFPPGMSAIKPLQMPKAEKPDPRKIAPNGKPIVEWRLWHKSNSGPSIFGWTGDDQLYYWVAGDHGWMRSEWSTWKECWDRSTPCLPDGTPLPTETKQPTPSNGDKQVMWSDMRRLADFYARQDYGLIEAIYEVFKEPA